MAVLVLSPPLTFHHTDGPPQPERALARPFSPDAIMARARVHAADQVRNAAPKVGQLAQPSPAEALAAVAAGIAPPEPVRLLTRQAVCARVSLSKTKVYDLIRAGRFPKAHEIEPGIRRWRGDEIDAWIDARAPRKIDVDLLADMARILDGGAR